MFQVRLPKASDGIYFWSVWLILDGVRVLQVIWTTVAQNFCASNGTFGCPNDAPMRCVLGWRKGCRGGRRSSLNGLRVRGGISCRRVCGRGLRLSQWLLWVQLLAAPLWQRLLLPAGTKYHI